MLLPFFSPANFHHFPRSFLRADPRRGFLCRSILFPLFDLSLCNAASLVKKKIFCHGIRDTLKNIKAYTRTPRPIRLSFVTFRYKELSKIPSVLLENELFERSPREKKTGKKKKICYCTPGRVFAITSACNYNHNSLSVQILCMERAIKRRMIFA